MIVGLGGDGLGITRQQIESLRSVLREMPIEGAVHRGCTGMETMVHNVIRNIYPLIPVHVVPVIGKYSSIASQPLRDFPQTIIYQFDTATVVNDAILKTIQGLIYMPEAMRRSGEGWGLVTKAERRGVPITFVWPNGIVTLERNEV